jgi:hypothetical protein
MSTFTVIYNNLQGPPNRNPVTSRGLDTEEQAIRFARSIAGPATELLRLESDGKTISWTARRSEPA